MEEQIEEQCNVLVSRFRDAMLEKKSGDDDDTPPHDPYLNQAQKVYRMLFGGGEDAGGDPGEVTFIPLEIYWHNLVQLSERYKNHLASNGLCWQDREPTIDIFIGQLCNNSCLAQLILLFEAIIEVGCIISMHIIPVLNAGSCAFATIRLRHYNKFIAYDKAILQVSDGAWVSEPSKGRKYIADICRRHNRKAITIQLSRTFTRHSSLQQMALMSIRSLSRPIHRIKNDRFEPLTGADDMHPFTPLTYGSVVQCW